MNSEQQQQQQQQPQFKKATVEEIFRLTWAEQRKTTHSIPKMLERPPKLNQISLHLSTEYLRLFTLELIHRSNQAAKKEEEEQQQQAENSLDNNHHHLGGLIQLHHLRRAAPGVLLDF